MFLNVFLIFFQEFNEKQCLQSQAKSCIYTSGEEINHQSDMNNMLIVNNNCHVEVKGHLHSSQDVWTTLVLRYFCIERALFAEYLTADLNKLTLLIV